METFDTSLFEILVLVAIILLSTGARRAWKRNISRNGMVAVTVALFFVAIVALVCLAAIASVSPYTATPEGWAMMGIPALLVLVLFNATAAPLVRHWRTW